MAIGHNGLDFLMTAKAVLPTPQFFYNVILKDVCDSGKSETLKYPTSGDG